MDRLLGGCFCTQFSTHLHFLGSLLGLVKLYHVFIVTLIVPNLLNKPQQNARRKEGNSWVLLVLVWFRENIA